MTTEDKLRELILSRYKSIREFTQAIDLPYTTMDSILRRGVGNSSVANIIKICKALRISVDELADGKIVHSYEVSPPDQITEIDDIVREAKSKLSRGKLTLGGQPVNRSSIKSIIDAVEVGVEIAKRKAK